MKCLFDPFKMGKDITMKYNGDATKPVINQQCNVIVRRVAKTFKLFDTI